jgi:predicted transcriptional regulator
MATKTVRIDEEKMDTLKIIASVERRDIKDILTELIDDYIERHNETLEILARPDWVSAINADLKAADNGETISWRRKKAGKQYLQSPLKKSMIVCPLKSILCPFPLTQKQKII